ncbi:MAG: hypothetical protein WDO14_19960 [Bacteroidota bacterium]
MKTLSFLALVLLCIACGSGSPDKKNIAVTGFPTPLYDGMVDATTGSTTKTIPPNTIVYLQNFELDVNNKKLVKVFVDDSTEGYVRRDWLLEGGRLGVVNCSEASPIVVYDDEEGQVISGKTMTETQLVSFKNVSDGTSQILYANDRDASRPFIGYIKAPVISDSLSMEFSKLYFDANQKMRFENNPAPMEALHGDPRFDSAPLRQALWGSGEESAPQASTGGHTDLKWTNEDGKELTEAEIPGKLELHYIWDDGTESGGNHLGDNLEQGTPQCGENKSAKGFKMVFTASKAVESVKLVCTLPSIANEEGPRVLEILNTEPGKTYEFEILPETYGVVCDEETTFAVQTNGGLYGSAMVHGSCGD